MRLSVCLSVVALHATQSLAVWADGAGRKIGDDVAATDHEEVEDGRRVAQKAIKIHRPCRLLGCVCGRSISPPKKRLLLLHERGKREQYKYFFFIDRRPVVEGN